MSEQFRFRVLGDSLAAGVGCARAEQTLGHLMSDVLRAAGHRVDLGVHAVSGARSTDLAAQVRAVLPTGVDLALVVIGANDLTSFTPPAAGAQLLHDAVADLRRAGARVVVATAPDLSVVSHVPPIYRAFVSQVSAMYARAQADAVVRAGGAVAAVGTDLHDRFAAEPGLFSADRFHPSPAGYALIAEALAPHIRAAAEHRAA
ncbi:SGNH/GDSL hydrolase family protein [Actinokineospora spheciospongiae]|uniref:SGNH/GDSL hydrolase family protein n=1 Tax=Actinokineospora spheciospongiae TaxID=909613 RepID=UPI000D70EA72|nr:SGNH/GDSL hydrolase family protein [Actinokineospora spheciospongiae]PWW67034.1 lysophospholipase L1-like esterase [Actinokineospora spheciospongiae]